jgi:hypothetical protein
MSDFLRLIQEATPSVESDTDNTLKDAGATPTKRGGILKKVVSGAQKISSAMDTIEKYGTGKWDINDVLQKMLSKQLDKSTDKVGAFGKGKYSRIKLGTDIIDKINNYTDGKDYDASKGVESSRQGLSAIQDTLDNLSKEGDSLAGESALNLSFLDMINEAAAALGKDNKSGKSKKEQVWDVLKSALDLPEDAPSKLTHPDPRMKKEYDRRIRWIAAGGKDIVAFLNRIKGEYPDIPFTFGDLDKEESAAIEQEEEEFNFEKTNIGDWIKTLGAERAEKIVKGLVDIYPAQRIVFDEPVEDEPVEDEPEVTLTDENALFELAGRTSFGEKGIQWTLKPMLADAVTVLKQRNIKYLTFLLQTNDNAFRAPESNIGIIYAYDNSNQPINPITTESVKFQWNGQEGLYTLSTDNKELMGIKYSEGQFPINKDEVLPLTDGVHILYRPDENSAYMKFKIVQDMNDAKMYLIDKDKGLAATDEDIAEAEAVSNK